MRWILPRAPIGHGGPAADDQHAATAGTPGNARSGRRRRAARSSAPRCTRRGRRSSWKGSRPTRSGGCCRRPTGAAGRDFRVSRPGHGRSRSRTGRPRRDERADRRDGADDRVDLLKQVNPETVEALLALAPTEERRDIIRLSQYPEGTAGSLMTTNVARLPESLTVWQALEEIARQAKDHETIYYIYIVDAENHLRGLVSARQLVTHLGTPDAPVADLMQRDLVTVEATDDQEAVAAKVADYTFLAIPVVDHEHHLVGIITHDDVIDVFARRPRRTPQPARHCAAGGIVPQHAVVYLAWKRGIWLSILLVGSLRPSCCGLTGRRWRRSRGWRISFR